MELRDMFEGSLGEHLPAALAWCEAQRVTTAADIAEAGLSEDFARDVLNAGGQATALHRSLLRKRLGILEAGLEAKRARRVAAISVSDAEGAGTSGPMIGPSAEPGAVAGGELQQKGLAGGTTLPSAHRPYKAYTAVCGVSARCWTAEAGTSRLVCDKVCRGTEQRVADHACSTHRSACKSFLSHHLHAPACHVHTEPNSNKPFKFFIDACDGDTAYCAKGGLSHANTPLVSATEMDPISRSSSKNGEDSDFPSSNAAPPPHPPPDGGGCDGDRKRRLPPHAEGCRRPFGFGLGFCNATNQGSCIRSADCKCYLDTEPDPYRRSKLVCICPVETLAAGFARARREYAAAVNEYKMARFTTKQDPERTGPLPAPHTNLPLAPKPAAGPVVLLPQPSFYPHFPCGPAALALPTGHFGPMGADGQMVSLAGGGGRRGVLGHGGMLGGSPSMQCSAPTHHPMENHQMGPSPLHYSPPQPYPSAWHPPDRPHPGKDSRY